jgi:23S rRNA pseudouridine1911/1915/1917 synthase
MTPTGQSPFPQDGSASRETPPIPDFSILYEEGPILAVNKPPGLLTQAPPGIDSIETRIKKYLIIREKKPGKCYLGVPHRLDRPVSGAMLFCKHVRAARRVSEQFEQRRIEKKYWACLEGNVSPKEGTWNDYLRKIPGQAMAEVTSPIHPSAREAILHYRVLADFPWGSWLEIELETGRTHQIRVQCASRGTPVLGDRQYGAARPFGKQFDDPRRRAIALHARSLAFFHPMTREPKSIVAPVSRDWYDLGVPDRNGKTCES